jgi:N-acetylglucosaminyldiphosphoundecaprenol N-acetyl-beta-D-mannosaminyltransferase
MTPTQQILGIRFFDGDVDKAVEQISRNGGYVVVPAAPALVKLRSDDEMYRQALIKADMAIADSGLMVLLWKIIRRQSLTRNSGLGFLKRLVREPTFREGGAPFFILPSDDAKTKVLTWAHKEGLGIGAEDCYTAPLYGRVIEDRQLLARIDNRRPAHIIIAIGNGPQEKLAHYIIERISYRPAIHCIGAALGFLTGDQVSIPDWADRFYFGWLFRLFAQPRIFIPRLTRALQLPWLIARYGERLPPMRKQRGVPSAV